MQDWEVEEPIRLKTRVVADLGFESIDLIQMIGALERAFRLPSSALVDMLVDQGRYVDDLSIEQIAACIDNRIWRCADH